MSSELIGHGARTVARTEAGEVTPEKPDMHLLTLLAFGHMVVDINGGAIPALLPFLKSALSLSYTSSGVIILMSNIMSSLIQPVFGYFSDKTARRWMLPTAVALSTIGIGLTGVMPSYMAVLIMVTVSGLGIAAYHPEGYRTATEIAGSRKATGISIFSTGGNIGIAVGPPLITVLVTAFGLSGSLGMWIPGFIATAFLAVSLRKFSPNTVSHPHSNASTAAKTSVWGMTILILVVAIRSWTQSGFTTFVPFYYIEVMRGDPRMVGTLLAIFLGSGAAGTLIAGPIADRIGVRRYAVGVFLAAAPLAVGYLFVGGIFGYVILGALGFVLMSTFTMTVALGQAYMPRNLGMASGLIVGFATGAGGLGVTVLGWVADHWGLITALWISALMPLLAFAVSLLLPEPD